MSLRGLRIVLSTGLVCWGWGWGAGRSVAFDVLLLVGETQPMKCRIDGLGDDFLVARVAIETEGNVVTEKRTIELNQIAFIDFEIPGSESVLLANPDRAQLETLRNLWESKSKWLGIRRSNSGAVGLAVANILLASGEASKVKVALNTFRKVEHGDWNENRRALAQQGRLRALLALDRPDEALADARTIAENSEDPTLLVETRAVMAEASRRQFEASLEEFPKWREDDEVRDEVLEQFHATIDQFLYPCLFHGSLEESAARGLWNASQVYVLAGEWKAAQNCAKDLVTLYPDTIFAERGRKFLKNQVSATDLNR